MVESHTLQMGREEVMMLLNDQITLKRVIPKSHSESCLSRHLSLNVLSTSIFKRILVFGTLNAFHPFKMG